MSFIKNTFALLIALSVCFSGWAQSPFSMEAYLKTASEDPELELYKAQMDFLEHHNFNKPWIQRMEVRIGSESADLKMDEYRLRLTPSNPAEIKANKIYHTQQVSNVSANLEVALNKALKTRYNLLISHYYNSFLSDLLVTKHKSMSEMVKLMGSTGNDYDMGDFISMESNISDLMIDLSQLKMEIDEINYFISLDLPTSAKIDWSQLEMIGISELREQVMKMRLQEEENNIYVKKAEQNLTLGKQMYRVDVSESKSNLGFVQGSMDYTRGNSLYDHFGLEIGLRLPFFNADKPDLNREKFKLLKETEELNAAKLMVENRSNYLIIRLDNLFSQYDLLTERMQKMEEVKFVLPIDKSINLAHMIRHRNYNLELTEKRLKVVKEIYENYIDYLDIKGYLAGQPLVNYLSPNMKSID